MLKSQSHANLGPGTYFHKDLKQVFRKHLYQKKQSVLFQVSEKRPKESN